MRILVMNDMFDLTNDEMDRLIIGEAIEMLTDGKHLNKHNRECIADTLRMVLNKDYHEFVNNL